METVTQTVLTGNNKPILIPQDWALTEPSSKTEPLLKKETEILAK